MHGAWHPHQACKAQQNPSHYGQANLLMEASGSLNSSRLQLLNPSACAKQHCVQAQEHLEPYSSLTAQHPHQASHPLSGFTLGMYRCTWAAPRKASNSFWVQSWKR